VSCAILIVGPSGSGKTTVGEAVARELGLPLLSMDSFRAKGLRKQFHVEHGGEKVRNYEDPRMWDGHALACKLRACVQAGSGFVCEGNHLLQYPEIAELSQRAAVFYVDVPFSVSVARRKQRNRGTAADWAFAIIGEEMTKWFVEPQKSAHGLVILDGTKPSADLVAAILEHVAPRALP
jgi:shikimate kinase